MPATLPQCFHATSPPFQFIVNYVLVQGSPAHDSFTQVLMYAGIITHCMVYFNSAINPIIYYFMSAQFKAQYRRILKCRCTADAPSPRAQRTLLQQEAEAGGGGGNAAQKNNANSSTRRDNIAAAAGARVLRSRYRICDQISQTPVNVFYDLYYL
jgi:molybdopterin biosynthesis enzyme